jgi:hypothetical protein
LAFLNDFELPNDFDLLVCALSSTQNGKAGVLISVPGLSAVTGAATFCGSHQSFDTLILPGKFELYNYRIVLELTLYVQVK